MDQRASAEAEEGWDNRGADSCGLGDGELALGIGLEVADDIIGDAELFEVGLALEVELEEILGGAPGEGAEG